MTEEEIKNELGEFYLDINKTNSKELFVNIINKFINLHPKFKPIVNMNKTRSYFNHFCENNNLKIIDSYFFIKNPAYNIKGGNNDICIAVDKEDIKHIILKRGMYVEPKEMHKNLSINTLRELYRALVYNVVNPMIILRNLKDIKALVRNFQKGKIVINHILSEDRTKIYFPKEVHFNDYSKHLHYKADYIDISNRYGHINFNFSDNNQMNTFTNLSQIKQFLSPKNEVELTEVCNIINQAYEKKIKSIVKEQTNLLNKIKVS